MDLQRRLELGTRDITTLTVYRYAIASLVRGRLPRLLVGRAADSRI
ncbi:MAG: hypothetical protein ACRDTF_17775 [Pseudonocardiaceae bacterium]